MFVELNMCASKHLEPTSFRHNNQIDFRGLDYYMVYTSSPNCFNFYLIHKDYYQDVGRRRNPHIIGTNN